jgi:hypothetical protein
MNTRISGALLALAATAVLTSLVPWPTAAQGRGQGAGQVQGQNPTQGRGQAQGQPQPYRPRTGCPEDVGRDLERCALERIKSFNPPKTPDGRPDIRGYWARTLQSLTLEERGPAVPEPRKAAVRRASAIVDPPDGLIPYQPWAAAQRRENFEKYVDPLAECYLPGAHRFPYISSGGSLFLQPRGDQQVVMLHEEIHMHRVIPTDGRPHIPANIKLYEGDPIGRWEGNTLVIDITNVNGKTWFDQIGDFLSDSAHIVERWTLFDPDMIYVQTTIEDPKVYTRPWKYALSMVRMNKVDPDFKELIEEACYEGNRDLAHLHASHGRYPGFTNLPAASGR